MCYLLGSYIQSTNINQKPSACQACWTKERWQGEDDSIFKKLAVEGGFEIGKTSSVTRRLCLHFSAAGWEVRAPCPLHLPATLHTHPGEAQSPRPSITCGCPKRAGHHSIPRARPLPSGEMCPRWGSCLHGWWWWWMAQGKHFSSPRNTRVHSRSGARFWLGSCCSPFS